MYDANSFGVLLILAVLIFVLYGSPMVWCVAKNDRILCSSDIVVGGEKVFGNTLGLLESVTSYAFPANVVLGEYGEYLMAFRSITPIVDATAFITLVRELGVEDIIIKPVDYDAVMRLYFVHGDLKSVVIEGDNAPNLYSDIVNGRYTVAEVFRVYESDLCGEVSGEVRRGLGVFVVDTRYGTGYVLVKHVDGVEPGELAEHVEDVLYAPYPGKLFRENDRCRRISFEIRAYRELFLN